MEVGKGGAWISSRIRMVGRWWWWWGSCMIVLKYGVGAGTDGKGGREGLQFGCVEDAWRVNVVVTFPSVVNAPSPSTPSFSLLPAPAPPWISLRNQIFFRRQRVGMMI